MLEVKLCICKWFIESYGVPANHISQYKWMYNFVHNCCLTTKNSSGLKFYTCNLINKVSYGTKLSYVGG